MLVVIEAQVRWDTSGLLIPAKQRMRLLLEECASATRLGADIPPCSTVIAVLPQSPLLLTQTMSVAINPSSSLGFSRPLTQHVKRALSISNHNAQPVAFKVKTTAPKLYCVRPNSGRVEPGETVEVQVMLQAMKEEPPMNAKCKDKFLIQSTIITPDKENVPLQEMWSSEGNDEIHSQKIRVVYLPPEGQTVQEEDETQGNMSSMLSAGESRFETVKRIPPPSNGHILDDIAQPAADDHHGEPEVHVDAPSTPPAEEPVSQEEHVEVPTLVNVSVHQPPTPSPQPIHAVPSGPDLSLELAAKDKQLQQAMAEIERLRSLISTMPEPSTVAPSEFTTSSELRRRARSSVYSDDDDGASTLSPATEVGSYVSVDEPPPQDGVPLQVVIGITFSVFVITYLFF
ncbi:PapD-like protein [Cristinia sonorae]|uniref:PapD-like protein n=1 Tax=Cristinia sonorae TaxID=1940300 RepID=A0A8K0XT57_9AGAR|nr:PapD-like protein [Cristinia sonorae]